MLPNTPASIAASNPAQIAVNKFFELVDVAHAPTTVCRRIFFEMLRQPSITLTRQEIETCEAISTLLAELEQAHPGREVA